LPLPGVSGKALPCRTCIESNVFNYFAANFNKLGLKKLISTSDDGSPIAGAQLTFAEHLAELAEELATSVGTSLEQRVQDYAEEGIPAPFEVSIEQGAS
jgi:hypothetical protein